MRKQRTGDTTEIPLPRRTQSKLVQSAGRSSKCTSALLLHQKLLPPGPPRSSASNGSTRTSQFCISSSSMGVRRLPARVVLISKGRFGKRPPSLPAEYVGPAIDSEDSGFGCDFHSSESQLSWCNDDSAISSKATTNNTTSIQQPIFSLSSRTLSNSNLSVSSQVSASPSSSPTSATTFSIPQFSASSPEKQFLTNLLHESLDQEDAVDPFDKPLYTTATTTLASPLNLPGSSTTTSQSLSPPPPEPPNVLLIVQGNNPTQPLDFAQVFGKLSSTAATSEPLVNNESVNEFLENKGISAEGQSQNKANSQFACDNSIIAGDQEPNQRMKLPPEIYTSENGNKINSFALAFSPKHGELYQSTSLVASSPVTNIIGSTAINTTGCNLSKLKDFLIESSREAVGLASSENHTPTGHSASPTAAGVAQATSIDPMVILKQAVSLQKELFEEPALDGIPISGKASNISGFGFAKGVTTTATSATSLKRLIVDSLPSPSLNATALVPVVPQQSQQIINPQQSMKLIQLSENVRMSPDSTEPGMAVTSTLPFSTHQVTNSITTQSAAMGVSSNSPTSTTSACAPSPIPMKRSRFSFPHPTTVKGTGLKLRNQNHNQNYLPTRSVGKRLPPGTTPTLTSNLSPYARDGRVQLQIVSQPEEQHRARYQTEGSRGAIKDRKGNGFPTVKLVGYDKPATLQIFIGTDQGKVSPHMFYQACKVTGKSSTPCIEKKVEGTILIEIEFEPSKEMIIGCDCVGILKERNVDVEQRFPFHHASQSRKKSTKCRMIFRTTVINSDGMEETLQVASLPILCTQPPGVPEICKQSLYDCPAKGGLELFVVGKNFLKDTKVVFQLEDGDGRVLWEVSSEPLKDYLQQNHLICVVPAFKEEKIMEPVECKVLVVSGGKHSEPHRFTYLPEIANAHLGVAPLLTSCVSSNQGQHGPQQQTSPVIQATLVQQMQNAQGLLPVELQAVSVNVNSIMPSREEGLVKTVIVSSPTAACSPVSITSTDGSLCSSSGSLEAQNLSQPSPPVTTVLNPLTLEFPTAPMIQTTTAESQAVNNFQSALQQVVQQQHQQAENKTVVGLLKTASELLESMKQPTTTSGPTAFSAMALQDQKPVVTNSIPLDLQFPTQDLPTVSAAPQVTQGQLNASSQSVVTQLSSFSVQETTPITTVNNPFQQNEPQLNCVSLPQIMSGIGINSSIPVTACQATSPVIVSNVPVPISNPQQQQNINSATTDVVMASVNSVAAVSSLSVADCLGQAIIKSEPAPTLNNDLRLTLSNNVVTVAPPVHLANAPQNGVMGLMGGELQPHQGTLANALSQMSDNELINYINPNCFEGPLL